MTNISSKKILVVTQHFYPESFRINDLVKGFVEDGCEVDVLCGIPNYPSGEWVDGYGYFGPRFGEFHGANVIRSGEIRRKSNSALRIFLNYISWPFTASIKAARLKRYYDVVFCYNTSPILMIIPARIAARVNHCPLVTYVLDIWPENLYTVLSVQNRFIRSFAKWFCDRQYAACNKLIAISDSLSNSIKTRLARFNQDTCLCVIPQHCEELYERHAFSLELRSAYSGYCVFLFAGSITPAQDLMTVIAGFAAARRMTAKPLKFIVLGDGMSRAGVEAKVSQFNLSDSIEFKGKVDPRVVMEYSDVADAMIVPFADYPELELTIPAKISSCMASSKPIVAVMRGEGATAVRDAHCGFVSDPKDIDSLAKNLLRISEMPDSEKVVLGSNGFRFYKEHYSKRICLDKLERVLFD